MDEHFRAFSFVDRITALEDATRIHGRYSIPGGLDSFSPSLVAESVGQLAAWAAMAATKFQRRPVAGIAARINLIATVRPGQVLDLFAELQSVDEDAIAYGGSARANGQVVIELENCVGPMVPVSDFDDPKALEQRFQLLSGPGAVAGAFTGVPQLALDQTDGQPGQRKRAELRVPASAPLFGDHFPRRPVFPGTLLMHMNLQLAAALASELPAPHAGVRWHVEALVDLKLRSFVAPGDVLNLEAKLVERTDSSATLSVESRKGNRLVGGAHVVFAPDPQS
jgi:3-hydroxyacyl-[acyl-carrier-protein] dehydratase